MILRPKPPLSVALATADTASAAAPLPVPTWLRRASPGAESLADKDVEDVALAAGATIGLLDQVVRRRERWAGAWRQRLALAAAAVTARQAGRVEDSLALRDAVLLTRPGDDVGPAGILLLAWRRLASWPAEKLLTQASIGAVLEELGYAPDEEVVSDLVGELGQIGGGAETVGMLTGAFVAAERYGFGPAFGAWLADALLAQRMGWAHALPLLGTEATAGSRTGRPRSGLTVVTAAGIETNGEGAKNLLAAQARAALRAIDLSAELERRANRLLAVAPKLRAKAADLVVERLLSDDAIIASDKIAGMSDRGLRRLFDRLVELGAVRELSGRPTFRIYGL
ncbi:DUF1403 family protein [Nitratireductor sp. StC3]|uniref:DUF1403 family protein n=1 Tax=Nitratireductor sp. StC3 TaxID=2126741 RepID=UPI000D0DC413|nr:DUF1403 family protein [Nitratireductor sp. StC3]PSM16341.1 hypothetical protein C7T96_21125 [Nitratireductor sp. StC3]